MGVVVVDIAKWRLVVDGMVENSLSVSVPELCALPKSTVVACQECYGNPLRPSDREAWRVANVTWTGPTQSPCKYRSAFGLRAIYVVRRP